MRVPKQIADRFDDSVTRSDKALPCLANNSLPGFCRRRKPALKPFQIPFECRLNNSRR
jgi:hypothetical protein